MKLGQQIETKIGNGVVTEISKKYVVVLVDLADRFFNQKLTLEEARILAENIAL